MGSPLGDGGSAWGPSWDGVGKTTTLGKLANLAVRSGYSCLIAAADTFRAAAVQQVQVWGDRSDVPVIANPSANADPAAVVFDAIGAAKAKGTELVLVDTAGRLQTKHNLINIISNTTTTLSNNKHNKHNLIRRIGIASTT